MSVGDFLVSLIEKVCLLPDIVFTTEFFVVVTLLFSAGVFIKILLRGIL